MGVAAVHVDLGENREADAVIQLAELRNLLIVARLLAAKLIARKAQYLEPFFVVFFAQGLKPLVLRSEAAFAGGIDDEQSLARELLEGAFLATPVLRREIVNGFIFHGGKD